jgi:hypothetical protein
MAKAINSKFIPTDIISWKVVGTDPSAQVKNLMKIDKVDEFIPDGTTEAHIRIILYNHIEEVQDSFFFSQGKDMELTRSFLQTTEANQKLMDVEMMLIQNKVNLNRFVVEVVKTYFMKALGFDEIKVI